MLNSDLASSKLAIPLPCLPAVTASKKTKRAAVVRADLRLPPAAIAGKQTKPAAGGRGDPVFAAILNHKIAHKRYISALAIESALEEDLPAGRRRTSITAYERIIVQTDDPRWIECEKAIMKTCKEADAAAMAILSAGPTTMQGAVALLQYAADHCDRGESFPDSWGPSMHRMLLGLLTKFAAARESEGAYG